MGLTVAQWADRILDGRTDVPEKPEVAPAAPQGADERPETTRLKTGRLPELPDHLK